MAVGETEWPFMHPVQGVSLGVANARIKDNDKNDLLVIQISQGSTVSGVFTKNSFCAEPVKIAKEHLAKDKPRYFIVNSGNANACTGDAGYAAAMDCCIELARIGEVSKESVIPFSTGVIGELLPVNKITSSIPAAVKNLGVDNWRDAAEAIMTTDTRAKGASVEVVLQGGKCKISGVAKGAGMINPMMGTMLAFVATDAAINQDVLHQLCRKSADASFNRITIDGDTSTNDACMLVATGKAENTEIRDVGSDDYLRIEQALIAVFQKLAQAIVRDGEGATKYVEVVVKSGGASSECWDVAYEIAHSPLVKTALFASDPNWGRIVAAIGNAGIKDLESKKVKVWLNDLLVVEAGGRADTYSEEKGQAEMNKSEITITVDLARGAFSENLWTTDLSHEYVKINAEYRS